MTSTTIPNEYRFAPGSPERGRATVGTCPRRLRIFSLIALAILLVSGSAVAFLYSHRHPTAVIRQSPTSSNHRTWVKYVSPLGFALDHPPAISVSEIPGAKGGVSFRRKPEFGAYEHLIGMQVLWRNARDQYRGIDALLRPLEPILVNGYPAMRISDDGQYQEDVWVYSQDHARVFRVIIDTRYDADPYRATTFATYQAMLSTFRFVR